ncbi:hypothetical protein ABT063_50440 [Streptomyces sp. NPDC002838]|uniref:hypothetical protein n=1 Tax=Streptomyces sp. NPDC002838 TaxID=3154436 RepID=UPI00331E7122
MTADEAPLGPDQAAARLGVRRVDFDYMRDLLWVRPAERREVRFGTSRAGAVMVPLFTTAPVDALPGAHPEVDWARAVRRRGRTAAASPARPPAGSAGVASRRPRCPRGAG